MPEGTTLRDALNKDILNDAFPPSNTPNIKTHDIISAVIDDNCLGVGYSDQTGRFPYQSSRGNNYIFVAYHYNSNAILITPLKDRQANTIAQAWTTTIERLKTAGEKPNLWILDNEFSSDMKTAFGKEKINFQLVPPKNH